MKKKINKKQCAQPTSATTTTTQSSLYANAHAHAHAHNAITATSIRRVGIVAVVVHRWQIQGVGRVAGFGERGSGGGGSVLSFALSAYYNRHTHTHTHPCCYYRLNEREYFPTVGCLPKRYCFYTLLQRFRVNRLDTKRLITKTRGQPANSIPLPS